MGNARRKALGIATIAVAIIAGGIAVFYKKYHCYITQIITQIIRRKRRTSV